MGEDVILGIDWIRREQPICNFVKGTWRWPAVRVTVSLSYTELYIPVTIILANKTIVVKALLDTGFSTSAIPQSFARELGVAYTYGSPCSRPSTAINGSKIYEFRSTSLNISIADSRGEVIDFCFQFDASGITDDDKMILGYDWIAQYQPVFEWALSHGLPTTVLKEHAAARRQGRLGKILISIMRSRRFAFTGRLRKEWSTWSSGRDFWTRIICGWQRRRWEMRGRRCSST